MVKGLSLTVQKGELLAVFGGNGTGKTTMLKLLSGLYKPLSRRAARSHGQSRGCCPKNPQALFVKKTVREDLYEILQAAETRPRTAGRAAWPMLTALCRLEGLLDRHPYDLSGGEQQRAALAKVLLLQPDILAAGRADQRAWTRNSSRRWRRFCGLCCRRGVTVLMVSHDIEFCARYAHRCALFFDGNIVTEAPPRSFFSGNSFYTTAANRMARGLIARGGDRGGCDRGLRRDSCRPQPELPGRTIPPLPEPRKQRARLQSRRKLAWWRKAGAQSSPAAAALLFFLRVH